MTPKPKTSKAPAAAIDPVFAAVAEHKALIKESSRLEKSCSTARAKAEKKYGEWTRAPNPSEWPGEATVSPFYDRWNRAVRAANKMAMRMAQIKPTTLAGAAALLDHVRREIEAPFEGDYGDWVTTALKTAASALTKMEAA